MMREGPRLNFWRAMTDNEMYMVKKWKEAYLHMLVHDVKEIDYDQLDASTIKVRVEEMISPLVLDGEVECFIRIPHPREWFSSISCQW